MKRFYFVLIISLFLLVACGRGRSQLKVNSGSPSASSFPPIPNGNIPSPLPTPGDARLPLPTVPPVPSPSFPTPPSTTFLFIDDSERSAVYQAGVWTISLSMDASGVLHQQASTSSGYGNRGAYVLDPLTNTWRGTLAQWDPSGCVALIYAWIRPVSPGILTGGFTGTNGACGFKESDTQVTTSHRIH